MISRTRAIRILEEAGCPPKVIEHCKTVALLAVEIAEKIRANGKEVDIRLVEAGALMHDLGRCRTHGISHAVEGFELARELGLDPKIAEIIKRHIGAGISEEEAEEIGLPADDYFPRSLEEKIVAHADNLVGGTRRITIEERVGRMQKKHIDKEVTLRVEKLAEEIEEISC